MGAAVYSVLMAVGAYVVWQAVAVFPPSPGRVPGPSVFPMALGLLLFLAAAMQTYLCVRESRKDTSGSGAPAQALRGVGVVTLSMVAYFVLLPWLGFEITTVAFLAGVGYYLGARGFVSLSVVPVVVMVAVRLVFRSYLHVALPTL